tara:strand:- start:16705 stop:16917 length:213 start_codon:yes stop_codon:yes gene_type:complete
MNMSYKKPRKYKCYKCGKVDENWSCAPWSRSEAKLSPYMAPLHFTCNSYYSASDKYKFDKIFLKSIKDKK